MQPMQPQSQLSSFNNMNLYRLQNRLQNRVKQAGQFVNNATGSISNAFKAFTNPNPSFNMGNMPAPPLNRFASSGNRGSSGVVDDGQYKLFTRDDLNKLYGNQQKKNTFMNTNFFSLGNGPIEHIIMMFQLYVALVAALARLSMNTASMGASFLFGNETLINLFSIFLENALNIILNRNVGEMTLDQLQKSLEENRPKLQQMSALLIKEMTDLALGLSSVCSKIAMDWATNVLPGLLKSSAIAASSAAEAGINAATMGAFGEIVEILSAGAATIGGILKIMKGLQSNVENFSEAYKKVSNAYDGVMKLTELFSKSPSEIAAAAESAIPAPAKKIASTALDAIFNKGNPFLPTQSGFMAAAPATPAAVPATPALAPILPASTVMPEAANPPLSSFNLRNLGKGVANAGIQRLKTFGTAATNTFSNFLKSPNGTPLKDSNGAPIETSWWKSKWKSLFDTAVNKIKNTGKYGKFNATVVEYVIRNPDVLIPFLPVPYNVAAVAFRLVQTYLRYVHQQNPPPATTPESANTQQGGGGGGNRKNKKSIKYKQKYLKKYISNLRRKTAKKELQLIHGIRDLKNIIR